jgi:hypothetical protein
VPGNLLPRLQWLGLSAVAAIGAAALAAPVAPAAVCGTDDTPPPQLFDSQGYYTDFTEASTTGADRNDAFATLYDGGSNGPADTPPGPVSNSDSWDEWGALFVGRTGDISTSNLYFSTDNNSCRSSMGGQNQIFPRVKLHGSLRVQRTIFVPPNGLPGTRILNLVTNPTLKPITTAVQVGDTLSESDEGDLGSDSYTAVRSSSSGNASFTIADRWAVTSDHSTGGGTTSSDPALAHVVDGPGKVKRIGFVTLAGTATDTNNPPEDNLAYRWNRVRLQPGQTVALMSFEVQQDVAGHTAVTLDANARTQALAWESAGPGALFAAMTKSQKAAVANWRTPIRCAGRRVTIAGSDKRDRIKGTPKADVIFAGPGRDAVLGLGGSDRICGGPGKDKLLGGPGQDRIRK